jgi:hypothetical protein
LKDSLAFLHGSHDFVGRRRLLEFQLNLRLRAGRHQQSSIVPDIDI